MILMKWELLNMIQAVGRQHTLLKCLSATLFFHQTYAFSAGFGIIEHSASGIGNAFAGSAAVAEDSSTIHYNPAGMTYLRGSQLLLAGHYISPNINYSDHGSITALSNGLNGSKTADAGVNAILPNMYLSSTFNKDISLGLGVNVPYGLTTEYASDWVGRYHGIKSEMLTVNINPSIALKLTEKISIGFGMNVQKLDVSITSAVDFGNVCIAVLPSASCVGMGLNPEQNDGLATVSGDSWSTGINLGTLLKITDDTRLGLAYRSAVSHTIEGDAEFEVPPEAQVLTSNGLFTDTAAEAKMKLPATASVSLLHSFTNVTQLLFDVTWTEWSNFKELRVDYLDSPQPDSITTSNWNDSYRFSMAVNHKINSDIKLRTGIAFDQSPIPDEELRTPRIPGSDRVWLSAGFGVDMTKNFHIDMGYAHIFAGTEKTNNTIESNVPTINHSLIGEYQSSVNIVSAQFVWII